MHRDNRLDHRGSSTCVLVSRVRKTISRSAIVFRTSATVYLILVTVFIICFVTLLHYPLTDDLSFGVLRGDFNGEQVSLHLFYLLLCMYTSTNYRPSWKLLGRAVMG